MTAYQVKTDTSDYPYLVLANSLSDLENKMIEKQAIQSPEDILGVIALEFKPYNILI
jgi:hypothetical protein